MRIVDVRERTVGLQADMSNAYIDFKHMTASTVAVISDVIRDGRPVVGFGFNSNGRYGASGLLRERFIPRLLAADPAECLDAAGDNLDPARIWAVLMRNEKPGGHGERCVAIGVLDMALWDLVAKIEQRPLHRVIAERFRGSPPDDRVFVYAAGGYYAPGKGPQALADEMRGYLDLGYTVVKMKIGGASLAEDLRRIEAVLGVVGKGERLAVDANARFDQVTALAYATALEPYGLRWYEEPVDPLDYEGTAAVAAAYELPLATGENLFSVQDATNLVTYAGLRPDRDLLQFDPALSYGLVEYLRMLEAAERRGWDRRSFVPHGGHQMALNIAAGLGLGGNESYPGVFQPFGGFADGLAVEDGHVRLPETPGVGFEAKQNLFAILRPLLD